MAFNDSRPARVAVMFPSTDRWPEEVFARGVSLIETQAWKREDWEVSDDEIWGISFPIRLGSLFLGREGFSKIN